MVVVVAAAGEKKIVGVQEERNDNGSGALEMCASFIKQFCVDWGK